MVEGSVKWRLVLSGHNDGHTNMAADEAIMGAVGAGIAPSTLRLYGWRPPAVSLGYFQELDDGIDLQAIRSRGWGLVRRPTGGRAILHDDEVTYSVCVPEELLDHGDSVIKSYRELSRGIEAGLQLLGAQARLGEQHGNDKAVAAELPTICFAQTARVDMTVDGRKIVGSAQVRRGGVILQHGSIPLTLNLDDHLAVMPPTGGGERNRTELDEVAMAVADALGRAVSFEEVSEALIVGFSQALDIELRQASLTAEEQQMTARLRAEKYATDEWNYTRPSRR